MTMQEQLPEPRRLQANQILGGSPSSVVIRLVVLSLVVGVILSVLGFSPTDIVDSLTRLVRGIYEMGFGAVERVVRYVLLGAAIVIPVWLVIRIVSLAQRRQAR
jgi:hypothetical protein